MPFVTEDGTGREDATSLVSVAESMDILSLDPFRLAPWEALDEAFREKLLATASKYLQLNFAFPGRPVNPAQAFHFPASGVVNFQSGYMVPTTLVPKPVKEAVVEIALWINDEGTSDPDGNGGDNIARVTADDTEIQFDTASGSSTFPRRATTLLGGFGIRRTGALGAIKLRRTL